ncbi:MAG: multicopper oxidase domain-containing protein [Bacteroidales bacterium]|jgi:CopA family copper-resistance protein|nr:multicopper oxidase domain-containing protein [Bacteroidales bacterium]
MKHFHQHILLIFCFLTSSLAAQQRVVYDLFINDTIVNYTGKQKRALAINGQIPAPTLQFTEGDTAVIHIHNRMKEETSLHWHGILLPNQFDGVSHLTSAPIMPGTSVTYEFPIVLNGTYWYHSHTGVQEQAGLYGAFVIRKRKNDRYFRQEDHLPEFTILLSDWTDMNAKEVNRKLHTGNDWFKIRKKSVQSYGEAIGKGHLGTKLMNELKRMDAMDVSDVYYEKFLTNGQEQINIPDLQPGSRIRLRIINGGASTYFWLRYQGGKITVIANDGMDVVPVDVDRIIIAASETYDIVVTVPEYGSAELQATAEDRSGSTSIWIGNGEKHPITPLPRLNYFAGMKMMNGMMKMNGDITNMGMEMELQKMDMNEVMYPEISSPSHNHSSGASGMDMSSPGTMNLHSRHKNDSIPESHEHTMNQNEHSEHSMNMSQNNLTPVTLNYDMLRSPHKTTLPPGSFRELRFELTGNMDRYVWTLNNKTVSESDKIVIREGENLRIVLYNNSMMRHPMHLHGHFFRVLNSHGDHSPLKFGVDIMPGETDTIEFHAGEKSRGDWFFHCHILYHMMSGMGRIFSYEDSPPNPQIHHPEKAIKHLYHEDRMYYFTAENEFLFNGNIGNAEYFNTRWSFQGEWQLGYESGKGYEAGLRAGRYIGRMQWLMPFVGVEWKNHKDPSSEENIFGQRLKKNNHFTGIAGVRYTLPMLIVAEARIDFQGKACFQLEREDIPLTSRLRMSLMGNTDKEYNIGLNYIITSWFGISASYNSEMKWGAGVKLIY